MPSAFAYSQIVAIIGHTITIKRSRGVALHHCVYQGMDMQVGHLFRGRGRMLMQQQNPRDIHGSMSGIAVGRPVAVVLFKKLNIETRVNIGHPFPRGGKRMCLCPRALYIYMSAPEKVASPYANHIRRHATPYRIDRLFPTVVSRANYSLS